MDGAQPTGCVLGLDVGGTSIVAALTDRSARVRRTIRVATPQQPEPIVQAVLRVIGQLLVGRKAAPGALVEGIGIACAGLVDEDGTVIRAANLGWERVPLRDRVLATYGVATVVENDANAAAVAEHLHGAGIGSRHLVYVGLGTGVGAGIIVGGRLYRGNGGAGEIGHMRLVRNGPACACGGRGCLEALVGGRAIARRAERLARRHPGSALAATYRRMGHVSARDVAAAAAEDMIAAELVADVAGYVGMAVGDLARVFDPDLIILGGGVAGAGGAFLERVEREARQIAPAASGRRFRLVRSALGPDAGAIGAASLIAQHLSRQSEGEALHRAVVGRAD